MPRPASAATATARRATNVTLPDDLLRQARQLDINLSQACERGLVAAAAERQRERWIAANRDAMDAWNAHLVEHGLPLAGYRQF